MEGSDSPARVLVAYGTKHGATREIAERIGARLEAAGLHVDVRAAGEVGEVDAYRAIVVGSALYMGRWRRDALGLLRRHRDALAERDVWLFSSGPLEEDPREGKYTFPAAVRKLRDSIGACEHIVFGGRVPPDPRNFMERSMLRKTPPEKRDARDWERIEGWADKVAAAIDHDRGG